jgi:hypothetical protein
LSFDKLRIFDGSTALTIYELEFACPPAGREGKFLCYNAAKCLLKKEQ